MEPQTRYAKTGDGVSIAWYAIGAGVPYVWPATPQGGGMGETWRIPEMRNILESIARTATLVVYDPRGFGLSDRGPMDFSCEAMVRDLEAVVDAAVSTPFILQTFSYMTIPVLAYAARHPEHVMALVLLNGIARGSDMSESWRRLVRLASEDWEYAKVLLVRTNEAAYTSTATLEQLQQVFEHGASKEAFLAFVNAMESWDASDVLHDIGTPALVAHYGVQSPIIPMEASRRLAASLPNGTFAAVEPEDASESRVERAEVVIRSFLRSVLPRVERVATTSLPSGTGTAIILFTDVADSTTITERIGDAEFRAMSRALDEGMRGAIRGSGGTPVEGKVLGDGVMGVFTSAMHAIQAAQRCVELSGELPLHIGLHAGDVISEDHNVYGGAVNIASRICGLCAPGDILVSATIRELARTSAGVTFEDRGEQMLKGIEDPVRLFAVRPA